MKCLKALSFAACSVLAMHMSNATATVITFGNGGALNALGYTEGGLTVTSVGNNAPRIDDWQTGSTGGTERELLFNSFDGSIRFSSGNGSTFNLQSLDVENPVGTGPSYSAYGTIAVTGSNGATANLLASAFGTQSFGALFNNILWFSVSDMTGQATIDNINISASTDVPEPGSLALSAVALAALTRIRRKSQK